MSPCAHNHNTAYQYSTWESVLNSVAWQMPSAAKSSQSSWVSYFSPFSSLDLSLLTSTRYTWTTMDSSMSRSKFTFSTRFFTSGVLEVHRWCGPPCLGLSGSSCHRLCNVLCWKLCDVWICYWSEYEKQSGSTATGKSSITSLITTTSTL